jgi:hypothetical protein
LVPVAFGPRIDSERDSPFLPDDPEVLVSRKQFNQVPMIVGLTKDEGSLFSASKTFYLLYLLSIFSKLLLFIESFIYLLFIYLNYFFHLMNDKVWPQSTANIWQF